MLTILKIGAFAMPDGLKKRLQERGTLYEDLALSASERAEIRAKTDIIVASGGSKFTAEDYTTTPKLKGIVCFSVGYDGICIDEAIKRNVFVSHTPNVLNDDVANTAMMLLLNTTRRCYEAQSYIEQGAWKARQPLALSTSISHKKLGIAGLGRIGKEIANRAAAFKMEIGYYGRHKQDVEYSYFENLKDLAAWCDVLLLAMPATSENFHCVNTEILEALGSQGYLINIARGSIVDTEALIAALDNGTIAGAGLDVFEQEPIVPQALQKRANVALQPHVGSATNETRGAMADLVIENFDAICQGKPLPTPVPGTRTK